MLRRVQPGSRAAKVAACSSGLLLPAVRSCRSRKKLNGWDPIASIVSSSLRSTNQHAALKWGHHSRVPQAPGVTTAPWTAAQALNRPTWGGSFSSGESGSDDDDDFYQDLSEGGFDELARSPPPSGPRLTPRQRAELQAEVAATSGLGAVTLFDDLKAEQQEAARRELEQLQREGGDVDSLAAQLAADGYDLDADWRELDRASSTTGRGKMNQDGGKGSLAQSRPTPADVLYAPPSNPRLEASRREARQEVTRKRRRLFDTPTENAGIIGGYVTEVNPSSEASQEALRRQSELRGQKLRNLPRKWSTDEPLEAPGPGGKKKASIDDALTDYFIKNLQKGYSAYQDKASGKFGLQRPKPPSAAEAAQQQQDTAVQLRRLQREQQERQQAREQLALDEARVAQDKQRWEQQAAEAEIDELEMLLAEQLGVATSGAGQKQGGLARPTLPVDPAVSSSSSSNSSTKNQNRPTVTDPVPQASEMGAEKVLGPASGVTGDVEEEMDDFEAAYAAVLAAQASSRDAGGGGSWGLTISSSSSSSRNSGMLSSLTSSTTTSNSLMLSLLSSNKASSSCSSSSKASNSSRSSSMLSRSKSSREERACRKGRSRSRRQSRPCSSTHSSSSSNWIFLIHCLQIDHQVQMHL
mmetsp:Transcript_2451/g.5595  ORF Transcript_2451/g.5595 Transcript_2451/m.5595 type:complete len:639 (+) Transcript_2451:2300-4216(+)